MRPMGYVAATALACLAALSLSCGKDTKKRSATSITIPDMEPPVTANKPANLSLFMADSSPKICASDDCPRLAATIQSRLFASGGGSIVGLLDAADTRIVELEQRSSGSYVPCFEADGASTTVTFVGSQSFTYQNQCYDNYSGSNGTDNGGQMIFGRTGEDTGSEDDVFQYYIADRYEESEDNVRSIWATQDTSENIEMWSASYDTANSNGVVLSHIRSTAAGIIEFARGGTGSVTGGVDFMCGTQMMLNSDFIYITGKIAAPSTTNSGSCDDVSNVTYCLNTTDFSEASDADACADAGLTTFTFTAIDPDDLAADATFRAIVDFDHSGDTDQFTAEDLEVEE